MKKSLHTNSGVDEKSGLHGPYVSFNCTGVESKANGESMFNNNETNNENCKITVKLFWAAKIHNSKSWCERR